MMSKVFKRVPYLPDLAVSADGVVIRTADQVRLTPRLVRKHNYQYYAVYYGGQRHMVHQLVAACWLPPGAPNQSVQFRDGNRANCAVSNLYWGKHQRARKNFSDPLPALSYRQIAEQEGISVSTAYRRYKDARKERV